MSFPDGPATVPDVKATLGIGDDADDAAIGLAVNATNAFVRRLPIAQPADTDPAPADWTGFEDVVEGAALLAARLFTRRKGATSSSDDSSPAFVAMGDPDVALLLQLGENAAPAVG